MRAAWMRASSDLRKRWRGALVLAVLLGIAGGIVLGTAAGARRTTTSYVRLLDRSKAFDVQVQPTGENGDELLAKMAKLPQVAAFGRLVFYPATVAKPGRKPPPFDWDVSSVANVDPTFARTMEIPTVLAGKSANPAEPGEATASKEFMAAHHLKVGDEFSIQMVTFDELFQLFNGTNPTPTGPVATVRIVGVWRLPHDFSIRGSALLYLTPAFHRKYSERAAVLPTGFARLRHGAADIPAFVKQLRSTVGGTEALDVQTQAKLIGKVDRSLGVQSTALWILALAVALASVLVLGQALGRWLTLAGDDLETLRALGMARGQRAAGAAMPAVAVGIVASVVAVVAGIAGSPLALFGLAREIDPSRGPYADPLVLGIGAGAIVVVVVLRAWVQGVILVRGASDRTRRAESPSAGEQLARRGSSPAMSTGLRFALESGRGRNAVPVRTVIAGSILSIAVVGGAFVFGRSLDHLLATPSAYGWNWDIVENGGDDPTFADAKQTILAKSSHVAALSRVSIVTTSLGGTDIETLGMSTIVGSVLPRVLDGRFPVRADEVALATRTLRREHLSVGGVATFSGSKESCGRTAGCPLRYRIVGRTVHWGEGSDPDDGAAFTLHGQARLQHSDGFTNFFIRVPRGRNEDTARRGIQREIGETCTSATSCSTLASLPVNLQNVASVRVVPTVLALILAAICLATILHGLVMCARRRGHDLAVLKTLGLVRRQVTAAIAWQAATVTGLALIVGVPIGVVLGRWAWTLLADRLGVQILYALAPLWLLGGATALLSLAIVVALWPARIAGRTRPALVLRTE